MNDDWTSKELRHFFGAYFHEDWVLEVADWQGVVDSYVQDEEPSVDLLRSLIHEIDEVSARCAEPDMRRFVTRTLGANYYPLPEFTYTEWLGQIAARLRKHASAIDGRTASSDEYGRRTECGRWSSGVVQAECKGIDDQLRQLRRHSGGDSNVRIHGTREELGRGGQAGR